MKINKFLKRNIAISIFVFASTILFGQNINTELRFLDVEDNKTQAGIYFTNISKTQFDQIIAKAQALKVYAVNSEFFEDKSKAALTLTSNGSVSVRDFQSVLKQFEIGSVIYKGKLIAVNEIEANYKPLNKTEVINKQRN